VLAGAGHRVADAGAGDEGSEAAQWLLVGEQFTEEFPERFGGRVLPAPQCHLCLVCRSARAPAKWRSS
jgi:hypothetical protein